MQKYNIENYVFINQEEAKAAQSEIKARDYLKEQLANKSTRALVAAYGQIIDQDIFKTVVGYAFLSELRELIAEGGGDISAVAAIPDSVRAIDDSEIIKEEEEKAAALKKQEEEEAAQKIPDDKETGQKKRRGKKSSKNKKPSKSKKVSGNKNEKLEPGDAADLVRKYRNRSRVLLVLCIALALMVAAMFVITVTSKSPTVLNYKDKIENEYATWAEELDKKEKELDKRERALDKRELLDAIQDGAGAMDTETDSGTGTETDSEINTDTQTGSAADAGPEVIQ